MEGHIKARLQSIKGVLTRSKMVDWEGRGGRGGVKIRLRLANLKLNGNHSGFRILEKVFFNLN